MVLVLIIIDIEDGGRSIFLETRLHQLPRRTLAPEGLMTSEVVLILEGLAAGRACEGGLGLRLE